ncbi:MAG: hypothetical protein QM762_06945 [Chryseolinea sp.]
MLNRIMMILSIAVVTGCLDPYYPAIESSDVNILVVDGDLDTSTGDAYVALSHGVALTEPDSFPRVTNAYVTIEDGLGGVYLLANGGDGAAASRR